MLVFFWIKVLIDEINLLKMNVKKMFLVLFCMFYGYLMIFLEED